MAFEFTLLIDRVPTDDELDALFDAGCQDAVFRVSDDQSLGDFDRASENLTKAISLAVHQIETAGFEAVEVRAHEDLIEPAIAYRREIAAANMMVQTRSFLSAQRR